jgi:3-oxoacyl-(acyl-carrier-protein) synthase/3-hydroxymyristoyl/3-hydroxydecanoyl-(acyl carrier protein) dehydratase
MTTSELTAPIAIVGRGCVLPGSFTPDALIEDILAKGDRVKPAPEGRWGLPFERIRSDGKDIADKTTTDAGSYVEGFELDTAGMPAELASAFKKTDPLFSWVLHASREALKEGGFGAAADRSEKVGLVLGNLSFPTEGMAHFGASAFMNAADAPWAVGGLRNVLKLEDGEPLDRFMSGAPAHLTAQALGLRAGAFSLDAACASSLYAIRLAMDRLVRGEADVMLAGAVNRADNLFLHVGFTALQALSKTGQSRPFHKGANGLVPGEGAGIVALMPLKAALKQGRKILGVIRGCGLSNDGRARNLLAPSSEGQVRALQAAWKQAGVDPATISLMECHATGTPLGDKTEVETMLKVFKDAKPGSIGLGSLKSNLGHLVTGAGIAGLLKVLGALEKNQLPPTLHADDPIDALLNKDNPFRLLHDAEPWEKSKDPRRAAVSAFGFGGNNAHVVVEEWTGDKSLADAPPAPPRPTLGIVGMGARANKASSLLEVLAALDDGRPLAGAQEAVADAIGLRFPPNDLRQALPQQVLMLEAMREAVLDSGLELDPMRTCVLVGMGCDTDITSHGLRWRLAKWSEAVIGKGVGQGRTQAEAEWVAALRDGVIDSVTAQGVLGSMPNIPANRLNAQFDARGAGFTVSAEELSGLVALDLARDLLGRDICDVVLVGAVDVFSDARDRAAADAMGSEGRRLGDAAVALIVQRREQTDRALAVVESVQLASGDVDVGADAELKVGSLNDGVGAHKSRVEHVFGHAHAASGLLEVAAAAADHARGRAAPASLGIRGLAGASAKVTLAAGNGRDAWPLPNRPVAAPVSVPMRRTPPSIPAPPASAAGTGETMQRPWPIAPTTVDLSIRAEAVPAEDVMPLPPVLAPISNVAPPAAAPAPAAAAPVNGSHGVHIPAAAYAPATVQAPAMTHHLSRPAALEPDVLPSTTYVPAAAGPWQAMIDARAEMAWAHQGYLQNAAHMQQAFLAMRQQQTSRLLALSGGVDMGSVSTLVPMPMPAGTPPALPMIAPSNGTNGSHPPSNGAHAQMPAAPANRAGHDLEAQAMQRLTTGVSAVGVAVEPQPRPVAPDGTILGVGDYSNAEHPAGISTPAFMNGPTRAVVPVSCHRPPRVVGPPPKANDWSTPEGYQELLAMRANPWLDYRDLEHLAGGRIGDTLGAQFLEQAKYTKQVRMPEPPLLLCDRVLSTDAQVGVLERNKTMWTETDVTWDKWWLHNGRIPPGILIESGQADLLLISYMGVDLENKGERMYRLLGCDLKYGHAMPKVGDVLHFDIHIDGFANHGDIRLFFFHSDCRIGGPNGPIVLSVRQGQAGFFTEAELADSGGILWKPTDEDPAELAKGRLDPPKVELQKKQLDRADLEALTHNDAYRCFGPGFEPALSHVRTPAPQGGDMLLVDRMVDFDAKGGPWGRGYARFELDLTGENWFYDGHFKDDPCMPGTLMFEGCLQCLDIYMLGLGYGLNKDGYRFEPTTDQVFPLRCRGQAIPKARLMVYELFIREVKDGPEPEVIADILVTVDGLKGLYCGSTGVRLVSDYPLNGVPELHGVKPRTSNVDGIGGILPAGQTDERALYDQYSLIASAWGMPSEAFGEEWARFDGHRNTPRLPGPPYHCMSRVTKVDGPDKASFKPGNTAWVEYDLDPDMWFFHEHGSKGVMPFSVLLETALQPCGWLATYAGCTLQGDTDLYFRNLDGAGTLHQVVTPATGRTITKTTLTKIANSAGMIIVEFDVEMSAPDGSLIYECTTNFGFFPKEALAAQAGVGSTDADKAALVEVCSPPAGMQIPMPFPSGGAPLPLGGDKLQLLDTLTGYWPEGGKAGLGRVRAEKDITGAEWFFKAHFFQDPVQPGSLGLEAIGQAVQWAARQSGRYGPDAVAYPMPLGEKTSWKYRGQVFPHNRKVVVQADILEYRGDAVIAEAWLWVDGMRIYHAPRFGIGIG